MLTVTAPNEVAIASAPYVINHYDADDRLLSQEWGGTNASGVSAGGTCFYARELRNTDVEPENELLEREVVTIIDRNGNETIFYFNNNKLLMRKEEKTRGIRASDPSMFVTQHRYTSAGLLLETTLPQGNRVFYEYDSSNPDIFQQGNVLSATVFPDARGADQAFHKVSTQYEPVFNQAWKITDSRGNDPSYVPPNGGAHSAQRYTSERIPDYFEGGLDTAGCECGHTLRQLVEKWGIDISRVQSQLNQGDLNEDGSYGICGNPVLIRAPKVNLRSSSQQANVEGSAIQTIETRIAYNKFSQIVSMETPEGEITRNFYNPENDPEGDGLNLLVGNNNRGQPLDNFVGGYTREVIADYSHSSRYRGTSAPKQISVKFGYDNRGNVSNITNARGVRSDFLYNILNQIMVVTRASDISQATEQGLIAFAYQSKVFYDHNNNVVRTESQYRDGNNPDLPELIESTVVYDILNKPVETTSRVKTDEMVISRMRYDPNENLLEAFSPLAVAGTESANMVRFVYDERDLVFQTVQAPGNPDERTFSCDYDLNGNKVLCRDAQDNNNDGQPEAITYIHDGFDRIIRVMDALNQEAHVKYDPASNAIETSVFGPAVHVGANVLLARTYAYHDELGRVYQREVDLFTPTGVATTRPILLNDNDATPGDGRITSFTDYDRNSRVTFATNASPSGAAEVSFFYYDGLSRIIRSVDALNNETLTEYDKNSNVIKTTRTDKSPSNRVSAETFVSVNVFDSLNRLTRSTNNIGQTRRLYYDSRNMVIKTTDAQGVLMPDPLGLYTASDINNDGNSSYFTQDGLGRTVQTIRDLRGSGAGQNPLDLTNPSNGDGIVKEIAAYDKNSRLRTISDDKNNTTTYQYDQLNRPKMTIFADGTFASADYDKDSNVTSSTDNNGTLVINAYDALNRITHRSVSRSLAHNVQGSTFQDFQYDGLSRLLRATDNNNPNLLDDDSIVERKYDSLGRVLEELQNGKAVSYNWREAGDLANLTFPNNRKLSYAQDKLNRITSIENAGGVTFGANTVSGANGANNGGVAGAGTGNANTIATYDFLGGRLLERVSHNNTALSMLNDTGTAQNGYDALGRLTQMRHLRNNSISGGSAHELIAGFTFGYNRENMKTFQESLTHGSLSEVYKYDSLYRNVDFQRGALNAAKDGIVGTAVNSQTWQLDGVGNWANTTLASTSVPSVTQTQAINEMNEYDSFNGVAQYHDANGNLQESGVIGNLDISASASGNNTHRVLVYDFANRLVEVWQRANPGLGGAANTPGKPEAGDKLIASYAYDAANRRISKMFTRTREEAGTGGGGSGEHTPTSEYASDANTIALYHFNETSGQVLDSSGNNNHGKAPNRITRGAEGLFNSNAVQFQGQPIHVKNSNSFNSISDKLTVETWVYLPSNECRNWQGGSLIRKPGSYKLRIQKHNRKAAFTLYLSGCDYEDDEDNEDDENENEDNEENEDDEDADRDKIRHSKHKDTCSKDCKDKSCVRQKATVYSDAVIALDQWVHIAAIYDGEKLELLVNCETQDSQELCGNVRKSKSNLLLGGNHFRGKMEESRISNVPRADICLGEIVTIHELIKRKFYYSGWQLIEEREQLAEVSRTGASAGANAVVIGYGIVGVPNPLPVLSAEKVTRQFIDGGLGIDEHLCQDIYSSDGTSIEKSLYFQENSRGDIIALTDHTGATFLQASYSSYGEAKKIDSTGNLVPLTPEEQDMIFYSFQSRQLDPETGLIYFRNRYLNTKQGRWLQRDGLGYVDGMGLHEAMGGNPGNITDPIGYEYIELTEKDKNRLTMVWDSKFVNEDRQVVRDYAKVAFVELVTDLNFYILMKKAYESAEENKKSGDTAHNYAGQMVQFFGKEFSSDSAVAYYM